MDKIASLEFIKKTFNFPFNEINFSNFTQNIFDNIDLNSSSDWVTNSNIPPNLKLYVKSYKTLGSYREKNKNLIIIAIIKLVDKNAVEKSRNVQRDFSKWLLNKFGADACLISFFSDDYEDWRFSFVKIEYSREITSSGKLRAKENITPVKRFSYLVGKNEPNYTAQSQLYPLMINENKNPTIDKLIEAFSVEKVTDDFFNDYKKLYLTLKKEIDDLRKKDKKIEKDFKENQIKSENFAKKTLGQIVFLFFLQRKGWLGIERNENKNFKKWGSGSKNFISELFKKYQNKTIKAKNFYNDILEPIFYDALNNPEDFYEKLDCKMPFLNGGLFDPINGYSWYETDILINDDIIKNILTIFSRYNFTVSEDQPLDREVAVDPEMLGKVFEKLLNEKDRKKGGAHYTPRNVVQYMCRKSIFYFLNKNLDNKISDDDFDLLFYYIENFQFDFELTENDKKKSFIKYNKEIDRLLKDIKICDPAIGSGAFPVSMMLEIVNIRNFFSKIIAKIDNQYEFKRNFIENNLYGVDIDTAAVDIAKLRLWLSLIVDEKSFEKINPLPNLDYKIMQGNSLVEKIYDVDFTLENQSSLFETSNDELSVSLFNLLDEYYNTSIKKNKHRLKNEIKINFGKLVSSIIEFSGKKISKENLKLINENINDIFNEKKERNFFLWNIFFHKVFKHNGGFDLIISNPPYIKEYTDKNAFSAIKDHKYYQGKMDLWHFMTCKSLDLIKENGVLCFIAQNNWFTNTGAKKLRSKIANDTKILEINDFQNYMVFDSADQQTMIMVLLKDNENTDYSFKLSKVNSNNFTNQDLNDFFNKKVNTKISTEKITFNKNKFKNDTFNFYPAEDGKIIDKIEKLKNFYLKNDDISNGIHPHHAKVNKSHIEKSKISAKVNEGIFVLNSSEIDNIKLNKNEREILKPLYYSKNLKKFYSNYKTDEFIIYTSSKFNDKKIIEKFPNIRSHLDKFKKIITSDFKPYGLHRKRNEKFFKGNKIASLRKCAEPKFTFTNYDCYLLADHYSIKTDRIDLKYLTLYLNSNVIKFWLKKKGKMQGNNYQIDAEPLLKVPIYYPKNIKNYLLIFDEIKKDYDDPDKILILEKKVNNLFFKLFNFSKNDIGYVEKSLLDDFV